MEFNPGQLEALVAIADTGSFDGAAQTLHVTPSAISQRIRSLETATGRVLVVRGAPCRPTAAGEALVRLGRETRLLYDEATAAWNEAATELPVAVNADSLATWLRPLLAQASAWEGVALRLFVEDQAHSHDLLRRGEVLGAITSEAEPVQGCVVEPLGVLRYFPVATPALADRFRRGRRLDWAQMPVVVFNEKDTLQSQLWRARGIERPAVIHRVPSSADFRAAVEAGLGWGLLPEPQAEPALSTKSLVRLSRDHTDVPLHWQRWRLDSPLLARLSEAVRHAARQALRRPTSPA